MVAWICKMCCNTSQNFFCPNTCFIDWYGALLIITVFVLVFSGVGVRERRRECVCGGFVTYYTIPSWAGRLSTQYILPFFPQSFFKYFPLFFKSVFIILIMPMFSSPFVYLSEDLLISFMVCWWIYQLVGRLIYCPVVSREYVNGGDHDHDKHFYVDFFLRPGLNEILCMMINFTELYTFTPPLTLTLF